MARDISTASARTVSLTEALRNAVGLSLVPCLVVLGRGHHHHAPCLSLAALAFGIAVAVTLPGFLLLRRSTGPGPKPSESDRRPSWSAPVVKAVPAAA